MRINIQIYFYPCVYIHNIHNNLYTYPVEEIFRGRNFDMTRPMYPDQFSAEEVHTDTHVYIYIYI